MNISIKELFEELLKSTEIRKIDFKRDQYKFNNEHQKSQMVKDILCFANAPGRDGYIVLGVKAEKGQPREVTGILYHHDSADLAGIINSVVEAPIQFEYHPVRYKGKECAIIHVPYSIGRPHWPKKNFGILKKHVFYTRRASGNAEASIQEIRQMCMETIAISDIAKEKAKVSRHVVDELNKFGMDERITEMYAMLKSIYRSIGLKSYRSIIYSFHSKDEIQFVLVGGYRGKDECEYCIFMYPWSVKMQNIVWSRHKIENLISADLRYPKRAYKVSGREKERIKISSLIHVAYKSIYTSALENRFYNGLRFENEIKEPWGRVIKWQEYLRDKEKYEFFIPNISSKEELRDRLGQLFEWIDNNLHILS